MFSVLIEHLLCSNPIPGAGNKSANKIKEKTLYSHGTSIQAFESFALVTASSPGESELMGM